MSVAICSPSLRFHSSSHFIHQPTCSPTSTLNPRKRKQPGSPTASCHSSSSSGEPLPRSSTLSAGLVILNGKLVQTKPIPNAADLEIHDGDVPGRKRFVCNWVGCGKSYAKPIRLQEHHRSHTNERPFGCPHCPATYRRDTHLTAHMRMHQPESARPLLCGWTETDAPATEPCSRRFWTRQHLNVHRQEVHEGTGKLRYGCEGCGQQFAKRRLLRKHHAETACGPDGQPLGSPPFACPERGCTQVCATRARLRKHAHTHKPNRYSCVHTDCLDQPIGMRTFASFRDLQRHTRDAHPPRCTEPGCKRTAPFPNVGALNAHRANCHCPAAVPASATRSGPFVCIGHGPCTRSYQSARALGRHVRSNHVATRHTNCPYCPFVTTSAFVSSLRRHIQNLHPEQARRPRPSRAERISQASLLAGDLSSRKYGCPVAELTEQTDVLACGVRVNRLYDLQRHLKAEHSVDVDREVLKKFFEDKVSGEAIGN